MDHLQAGSRPSANESLDALIHLLKTGEPHKAEQAANRLRAAEADAVMPLLEALGDRKPLTVFMDPLFRKFDRPGRLPFRPPEKLFNERVEEILISLGPAALPELARGFDHPDFRVREAAARVIARQDRAAIPVLLNGLCNPRARFLAGDALVSVGKPAVDALLNFLKSEPIDTQAWEAADAAFCGIVRSPTHREVVRQRSHLTLACAVALVTAGLALGIGLWAELGLWPSVVLGLACGYGLWAVILHESDANNQDETAQFVTFLIECITAPLVYRDKVRRYNSRRTARERLAKKFGLPG